MSEVANTPRLRFPGFSGKWEEKTLGSMAVFYNSQRVPLTESDRVAGEYPYYGASGIIDYVKDYIFDGEYILLGEDGANIVMRSSRLVFLAKGKFWVNNHAHIFQAKESNYFLCEALERINYSKYNTGTAQPKLNSDVVKKIKLSLPAKPEQQKIAAFLTAVDTKIEQLSKKQELLGEYKKGLMQQIFSQVIRFEADDGSDFPDWEEKKLKDISTFYNGRAYKQAELLNRGKYPVLRVGNFYTNKSWYYSDLELDENKYCDKGDLLYAWSASFGPKIWDGSKVIYHYHIWKVINHDPITKQFLYILLDKETEKIKTQAANGFALLHITKGTIENWTVVFPGKPEQQKIVEFLNAVDNKIEQVGKQLDESKQFKKALLQQMFV
jgi:type I restriction enzyme S subunit